MKKIITLAVCLSMSISATFGETKKSQKSDNPKNNIKLNPLSLILSTINLSYERNVAKKINVQLGAYYTGASAGSVGYSGFGLAPMVRFYLSGGDKNMKGFYLGPTLRFNTLNLSYNSGFSNDEFSYTSFGGGSDIGYQFIAGNIVTFDLFGGIYYNAGSLKYTGTGVQTSTPTLGLGLNGLGPNFGFKIGVAF